MNNNKKRKIILPPPMGFNATGILPLPVITDPFGSYTGVPLDTMEIPVQDADDL